MRIEKLEVSGLRSHRGNPPTELTLSGKRLVAVVGHTGAGKSSLLEAITFALFGEATYGGQAYEELSSDGRSEITVQLTFTRGDERFQLQRTVTPDRNGKFHNKVIYLRRVDDAGNTVSHTERVREVDKAVSGLLGGMTREQFCQAVLLAQNRFGALLEANPKDRDSLLDTLLGLNSLAEARTALQKTRSAAGRNIERLEDRRAVLPTDPSAEAAAAKERAKSMDAIAEGAAECGTKLEELAQQGSGLTHQAAELEHAAALRTIDKGPSGAERLLATTSDLEALAELEVTLSGAETQAAADLAEARQGLERATDRLKEAETNHGAAGRHQVVAQQLENLGSLLAEKPGLAEAVTAAQADVQRLAAEKGAAQQKAATAKADTDCRRTVLIEAQQAAAQAATAVENLSQALSATTSVTSRLAEHARGASEASGQLDTARSELAAADAALEPLTAARADAQRALDGAVRSEAAAAVSHGCSPGDDCPVCGRELPDSWQSPPAGDLDAARNRAADAQTAVDKATERRRLASEAYVKTRTRLRSTLESVSTAHAELATVATDKGLASPPTSSSALCPAEADGDEALVPAAETSAALSATVADWLDELRQGLAPLEEFKQAADTRQEEASEAAQLAEASQAVGDQAYADATTELGKAEERARAAKEALQSCKKRLAGTLAAIDERWRKPVNLDAPETLETTKGTLGEDQAAVDAAVQRRKDAESAVAHHETTAKDLENTRATQLTAPLTGARATLRDLTELVNDLCGRLELPIAPAVDQKAGATALHSGALELQVLVARAVQSATVRCTHLRAQVQALVSPASEIVSALVVLMAAADPEGTAFDEAPDPASPLSDATRQLVQQVVGRSKALAAHAKAGAEKAERAVKTAKELDERLTTLGAWASDLDGAIDVLGKNQFPRWARGLKMADLVDTASEHLSEMTDSRFRFDPALQISDEVAGVVRKASTLSGGEKFEASLALALGVSEIAGRSGIRIETLFLDEGFAGLDQAHLNRALDALEREVELGRSIVLITHIGAVADRIPDVLLIKPDGAGGSTTKWLDEDERFELGADLDLAVP